jgi:UDP-N-acetylmuramate dehydrogenase
MTIQEYVNIKDYSTLRVGGQFRYFTVISTIAELASVCAMTQTDAKYKDIPVFVLGGGSNIVFSDGILNVFALKIEIKGFEIINDTEEYSDIKVGGGEVWDEVVKRTVDINLSGIEFLSGIPGTIGATPVQNVGAYGIEVKDTIQEVEVFDINSGVISIIPNEDCNFEYRDSIFKNEAKGRYVIIAVTYRLSKFKPRIPDYPGVKRYFIENNINIPTLDQIRNAIINVRNEKLPNPKDIPNVGSFFKNPVVSKEMANDIKMEYPEAKFFHINSSLTKIPAGWLIENAGLKGKSFGKVSVYDKNALILVNNGDATKDDFINTRNEIINTVQNKFGITLEQEPEIM